MERPVQGARKSIRLTKPLLEQAKRNAQQEGRPPALLFTFQDDTATYAVVPIELYAQLIGSERTTSRSCIRPKCD